MVLERRSAVALTAIVAIIAGCTGARSPTAPLTSQTGASATPIATTVASSPGPTDGRPIAADASIDVGLGDFGPKVGPTGIWIPTDQSIIRIDPATNSVATTFPLGESSNGYGLAIDAHDLWVTNFNAQALLQLDPVTGKQRARITTEPGPGDVLDLPGGIWVANHHAGSVSRIDPKTNKIVQTISVGPAGFGGPGTLTAVPGGFWVGFGNAPAVVHIDTKLGKVVATVKLPSGNSGVIPIGDQLWVDYQGDAGSGIAVLNASGDAIAATIDVGGVPGYAAWPHDGVVWLPVLPVVNGPGIVVAIDPATNQIVDRLSVPDGTPSDIIDAFGSVWLLLDLQGKLERFPESDFTVEH